MRRLIERKANVSLELDTLGLSSLERGHCGITSFRAFGQQGRAARLQPKHEITASNAGESGMKKREHRSDSASVLQIFTALALLVIFAILSPQF